MKKKLFFLFFLLCFSKLCAFDLSSPDIKLLSETKINNNKLYINLIFSMPEKIHIYADKNQFFEIKELLNQNLDESKIIMPEPKIYNSFGQKVKVYKNHQTIKIIKTIKSEKWKFKGYVQIQACDDKTCYAPKKIEFEFSDSKTNKKNKLIQNKQFDKNIKILLEKFDIVNTASGYMNVKEFQNFLHKKNKTYYFENYSFFIIILLVFLGGFLLNFTPCILPIIPITATILKNSSFEKKNKLTGFIAGMIYAAAITITYGLVGILVVITGAKFGTINSYPIFNFIIAIIFFVLSLGMFDLIRIDFSKFRNNKINNMYKIKYIGIFLMGIITALLAGSCVAPVVISVIIYSASLYMKNNYLGLFLPFILGAGMSSLWPVIGMGISVLPKPGKWMIWLKYLFGFVILLFSIYYIYIGINLLNKEKITFIKSKIEINWINSIDEGLKKALKTNKKVLIDFSASWCKNCVVMDETTFLDKNIQNELKNMVAIKFLAEKPNDKKIKAILDLFKVYGLPTYILLKKK